MNVVVYGATGNSGSEIVKELTRRRHKVIGVARHTEKLKEQPGVTAKTDDLSNVDAIANIIKGADVVVSAYQPPPDNTLTKASIPELDKALSAQPQPGWFRREMLNLRHFFRHR